MLGEHYAVSEIALKSNPKHKDPQLDYEIRVTKLSYVTHVLADLLNRAAALETVFMQGEIEIGEAFQVRQLLRPFFADCEEATARGKRIGVFDESMTSPIEAIEASHAEVDPGTGAKFLDWPDACDIGPMLEIPDDSKGVEQTPDNDSPEVVLTKIMQVCRDAIDEGGE